ncbi:MAG: VCBS repeat-containing protein [Acidobacteria bacterium]|nr:VCBS repeat-containing protein [Acidobacteriota bacterium]
MNSSARIALLTCVYVAGLAAHGVAQGSAEPRGVRACTSPFAAGPLPSAAGPTAVAFDPATDRLYVVHRALYGDVGINAGQPTNLVSVVNARTSAIVATVAVGAGLNGIDQGLAVDSARNRIYVTNADAGTVSVIDGAANPPAVAATVTVARNPLSVAVDSGANRVYVASSFAVTVLDATTASVLDTVELNGAAGAIAVDTTTHKAYVVTSGSQVLVIDGTSVSDILLSLAVSPKAIAVVDGSRVYAAFSGSGIVSIIDIARSRPAEIGRIYDLRSPSALAVDSGSGRLYVTEAGANRVSVWTADGAPVASEIAVQRLPSSIAIDATGRRAYVTDTLLDGLTILNTDTLTSTGRIPLGTVSAGLAYDGVSASKRLYVANYAAGTVTVVDPASCEILATWLVGDRPWSVAVDPDLKQLYVLTVLQGRGTLHVLSTVSGSRVTQIDLGYAGAGRIAVNRTTHRVYVTSGSVHADTVSVVDGSRVSAGATPISVGSRPVGVTIDETIDRIYVANQQSGTISVIDGTSGRVIETWRPTRANVWGLAVDPGAGRLYVSVPGNLVGDFNGLQVLNSSTGAFIAEVQVQIGLSSETYIGLVAVNRTSHRLFVTEGGGNAVAVVNPTGWTAVTVPLGSLPHDLVIDETASVAYIGNAGDGTIAIVSEGAAAPSCSYSITPTSQAFGATSGSGSVSVTSGTGCGWTATSNVSWVTIGSGSAGSGNGTVSYSVASNSTSSARSGTLTVAGQTVTISQSAAPASSAPSIGHIDFNGDSTPDVFTYGPSTGDWSVQLGDAQGGFSPVGGNWSTGWRIQAGDFNGDGRTDFFLYAPSSGRWYKAIANGTGGFTYFTSLWSVGWTPYVIDLNGDGKSDVFLFNATTGTWYKCLSAGSGTGEFTYYRGDWSPDWELYAADFNGDGLADFFLFSRSTGQWYRATNDGGAGFTYVGESWSNFWEIYPGDYNGDGLTDIFLYRSTTGDYFFCTNTGSGFRYSSGRMSPGWTIRVGFFDDNVAADLFLYNAETGDWYEVTDVGNFNGRWSAGWQVHVTNLNTDSRSDILLYSDTTGQWFQAINTGVGTFRYTTGTWARGLTIIVSRTRLP